MQITERRVGNAVILDLVGELTYMKTKRDAQECGRSRKANRVSPPILNMHAVRFLDSSALRDPGARGSKPEAAHLTTDRNSKPRKEIIHIGESASDALPVSSLRQDGWPQTCLPAAR